MDRERLEHLSKFIDVDDLMKRCFGRIDFATLILGVLNDSCEADVCELEEALTEANAQRVAKVSHRLKGALANSAAFSLSKKADELSTSAHDSSTSEMSERLVDLRREWDQLAALINDQVTSKS